MFFLKKRQAELIVSLAETANLRRSAELLHMTQPAASKVLAQTEAELGFTLFDRSASGTVPTVFGAMLIPYAREILHSAQRIQDELARLGQSRQRCLKIGALPTATISIVPELVCSLMEHVKGLQVSIEDGTVLPLLEKLRVGKLDLVIGRSSEQIDLTGFNRIILDYEPMVLVCGRQHPLTSKARITSDDLRQCNWIFPPEDTYANLRLIELCDRYGLNQPHILIRSSVTMSNVILLERQNLIAALPLGIAQYFIDQGILHILPTTETVNFGEMVLYTHKDSIYAPNANLINKVCAMMKSEKVNS